MPSSVGTAHTVYLHMHASKTHTRKNSYVSEEALVYMSVARLREDYMKAIPHVSVERSDTHEIQS